MTEIDKRRLQRKSSLVGFLLFFYIVIEALLMMFLYKFFGAVSTLFTWSIFDFNLTKTVSECLVMIVPMFLFTGLLKVYGKRVSDVFNFKSSKKNYVFYIFTGFLVGVIANYITNFITNALSLVNVNSHAPINTIGKTALEIFLSIIEFSIIPAIVEEFVFRGVILNFFRPYGDKFAIAASAILFALLHGNLEQFAFAFIFGLYLGYVAVKTNTVVLAVIIHFLNNFTADVINIFKDSGQAYDIILNFYHCLIVVSFFVFCFVGLKNMGKIGVYKKLREYFGDLEESEKGERRPSVASRGDITDKIYAFVANPGMLMFLILSFFVYTYSLR